MASAWCSVSRYLNQVQLGWSSSDAVPQVQLLESYSSWSELKRQIICSHTLNTQTQDTETDSGSPQIHILIQNVRQRGKEQERGHQFWNLVRHKPRFPEWQRSPTPSNNSLHFLALTLGYSITEQMVIIQFLKSLEYFLRNLTIDRDLRFYISFPSSSMWS